MNVNDGFKYMSHSRCQVSLLPNRVLSCIPVQQPHPFHNTRLMSTSTALNAYNGDGSSNQVSNNELTADVPVDAKETVEAEAVAVNEATTTSTTTTLSTEVEASSPSFFTNLKSLLSGKGWNGKHALSRDKLAKMGLNVLLSYGFVSNVSYITCMMFSWVAFGKKYGVSPLAKGQWKAFLLIYSGFWAANNILRPARFSLSLVLLPLFDKLISFFQHKLNLSKRKATGLTIFLVNFCGTISFLVLGLTISTSIAKVPLLP